MLEELLSFDTLAQSQNHTGEHRLMEERGELVQIANSGCFRHLVYLELKAGNFFRGKHYHQRREEVFYVISGRVKAVFEDIETRERLEKVMNAGDKVLILPKCAHVFFPIEYSQLLHFSKEKYDSSDVYPYDFEGLQP